jgi:hypothetical protein
VRRFLLSAVLASVFALSTACGGTPEAEVEAPASLGQSAAELTVSSGVIVSATYSYVVVGTPTYGNDATAPVLTVRVEVDDAAIRAQVPGFDGFEQVFVQVPKLQGGSVVWESHALTWKASRMGGYYAQIRYDIHESGSIWGVHGPTLEQHGVAVGLNTNVGTLWAQQPGQNFPVTRK